MEITIEIPVEIVDHITEVCEDLGINIDEQSVAEFIKQDLVTVYDNYYRNQMGDAIIQYFGN